MEAAEPKSIGRYRVQGRIGAGAMGVVYLCQDPLLKRKVAVKTVSNLRADSEIMQARFQRESEISAQLNHPCIITVFDVGHDEVTGPFITMEFVDGSSLAQKLQEEPVEPLTGLDWLRQLGEALVVAERSGVIHRDIKPENILISKEGRIKLMDFGLARNDETRLTTTGVVMGTPTHTAPELLSGAAPSFATDRWAFYVTAFQIFTGNRLPHNGDTISGLLNSIANEPVVLPPGMPAPLARVFLKALHHEPARRYPSMLAFLEALSDALGLRDRLDTRGLAVGQVEMRKDVTMALDKVASAAHPHEAEEGPGVEKSITTVPPTTRLTAPPKTLFKGGQDAVEQEPDALLAGFATTSVHESKPHSVTRKNYVSNPRNTSSLVSRSWVIASLVLAVFLMSVFLLPVWPLQIDTRPVGASVFIDHQWVGRGPLKTSVRYGRHNIQVALEGYETEIILASFKDSPLFFELKPLLSWCDVISEPAGAELYVEGRLVGKTPYRGLRVPDVPQQVVLKLKGYRLWEAVISPARPLPQAIELKPE